MVILERWSLIVGNVAILAETFSTFVGDDYVAVDSVYMYAVTSTAHGGLVLGFCIAM